MGGSPRILGTGERWLQSGPGSPRASRECQGKNRSVGLGKQRVALPQCLCFPRTGRVVFLIGPQQESIGGGEAGARGLDGRGGEEGAREVLKASE